MIIYIKNIYFFLLFTCKYFTQTFLSFMKIIDCFIVNIFELNYFKLK